MFFLSFALHIQCQAQDLIRAAQEDSQAGDRARAARAEAAAAEERGRLAAQEREAAAAVAGNGVEDQEELLAQKRLSSEEQKAEQAEGYKRNAFNQFKSDRISLVGTGREVICDRRWCNTRVAMWERAWRGCIQCGSD